MSQRPKLDRARFWQEMREQVGFGNVDPEDENLVEIIDALEAEGVDREKARLAVLVTRDMARAEAARMVGNAVANGARALWERLRRG